jgi:translation initiation factor 2B subunit (eIF-2B alpha/beta/delta family)
MAKKPQKEVVEDIVKNLVDSEISGIQSLAKDMMERIRQLEEHSERIKKYTDEIEKLATEAASEKYDKASLDELIKNLETTLTKLRKKKTAKSEITSPAVETTRIKPKKQPVAEKEEVEEEEEKEEEAEEEMVAAAEEIKEEAINLRKALYTTPEGFVVRKTRR